MAKKISPIDERMVLLMEWAVKNDLVIHQKEYWKKIGFTPQNLTKIKMGLQGFRIAHIKKACEVTGASADWVFGFSNIMKRKPSKQPIDQLKEAVFSLEVERSGR